MLNYFLPLIIDGKFARSIIVNSQGKMKENFSSSECPMFGKRNKQRATGVNTYVNSHRVSDLRSDAL